jgi:hypothetical protein
MDEARFRELTMRAEDHRLDFKSGLYTSNDELTKDLMAIANLLPPASNGHILLGVRQRPDDTGEIVGVALGAERDSQYQQKVAGRLNRSPRFTFYPLRLSEGEVGAFEITGVGERPYFPIVTAGRLRKFVPQKRLGSSTAEATPDEVKEWVLEDQTKSGAAILLIKIPHGDRDKILIAASMLTQNFDAVQNAPLAAVLLDIDSSGSAARFHLSQKGDIIIPLNAISSVWREGNSWQVLIDGYVRHSPLTGAWEYQPRSRARS